MQEFGGRTGEVGWGCGVWGRVERGGLRWVGIELRWEGLRLGEAGFEEVGIERRGLRGGLGLERIGRDGLRWEE